MTKYQTIMQLLKEIRKNNLVPNQQELQNTVYYNKATKKLIYGCVPNNYYH